VGPALGGLLAGFLGFRSIFLLTGTIISVAAVLVILLLEDSPPTPARPGRSPAGNLRFVLGEPRLRIAMLGLVVAMAGVSMAMPVFPLFVEDLLGGGDAKAITGIGFAVVAAFTLVTSALLGRIAARVGLKAVLVGALSLCTAALWLHTRVGSVPAMLGVRALLGVALAGVGTVLQTMIIRAAPEGMRGGITGFASSGTILGFFVGPITGGWLANHVGVLGVFRVAAGVTAACALGAAVVARRIGRERRILPVRPEGVPR
jgi:DHA1 family multidrug resistance protein-like MFS transporter